MIATCGRYALALHMALFPFIVIVAPRGTAAVAAVTGALCLLDSRVRRALRQWIDRPVARLLLLLLIWIGLSALWAIDAGNALETFAKQIGQVGFGLALLTAALSLPAEELRMPNRVLAVAAVPFLIALYAIALTQGRVAAVFVPDGSFANMFYRQGAVAAVLLFPLALAILRESRTLMAVAYAGSAALCVLLLDMNSAKLALGLAVPAALAVLWLGRRGVTLVGLGLAVAVLAMPFLPYHAMLPPDVAVAENELPLPITWVHRLFIWDYVSGRIEDAFMLGFGAQSSRSLTDMKVLVSESRLDIIPLHPHNAALQIWLELGLIGALLFAFLVFAIARSLRAGQPVEMATGAGAMVSFAVIACVSYGAWQNWWLACAWTAAAMTILAVRRRETA
ncbi:MAG: O-antigen ligase family protein [Alphaproteobacteria bacterium]